MKYINTDCKDLKPEPLITEAMKISSMALVALLIMVVW